MIRKNINYSALLVGIGLLLYFLIGCKSKTDKNDTKTSSEKNAVVVDETRLSVDKDTNNEASLYDCERDTLMSEKEAEKQKSEAWINENVTKDFLLGNVTRKDNQLFVQVSIEHTERNIYLIPPVYDAYKKMYEAALADNIKLIIISGHRTFIEQVYEWQLRWNNPRTDIEFTDDVEKAKFVLQYRSMPGTTRHHWGTDIDLNSFELAYYQTSEGVNVYNWLNKNAAAFGFYQPYTAMDEKRPNGYKEEKWHWSYKPLSRLMLIKYLELTTIDDITGFEGDTAAKILPIVSEWVCGINTLINEED